MLETYQEEFLNNIRGYENLILVEGKKDRRVLEKLGLENIIEISGKRLEKVVDIIQKNGKQVSILTDYDKEGIKQYKRLKKLLSATEIKVNDKIRRDFKRNFLITKIEELSSYLK